MAVSTKSMAFEVWPFRRSRYHDYHIFITKQRGTFRWL